jgi:hypothetical protein
VAGTGRVEAIGGSCEYYDGKGLPPGVSMMTDEDRVVRFDLGRIRRPARRPSSPVRSACASA